MASKRVVTRLGHNFQHSSSRLQLPGRIQFSRQFSVAPPALLNPTRSLTKGANEDNIDNEIVEKPFEFDDFSSMAHDDLEQHREARDYARIAAYEMPLLAKYAKKFQPPTPSQILRFRYTTYMGEQHPAENKVVLEFCTHDLGLSDVSRRKFIKLCGKRYNPEKDLVHISCEMFETQAQNKRYLSDQLDRLLDESKDLTDTFEDIPFDFRHHEKKVKIKPKFPKEWRMPKERRHELFLASQAKAEAEAEPKAEI